ncbi:hypothetical protein DRO59_07660 [Candidatus Bathyarchaeota archaeon]|nr:MAG: hypothetical protein DRO59_07660 [Candidatus Bathyarchaeota archaeon]
MVKIGMITIGQSPRKDVTTEIRKILGVVEIVEIGCLDKFTREQIEKLEPKKGELFLVTLLRDGNSVKISKGKIMNLMQQCIRELESQDVALIALLCTGDFPDFESKKPMIKPGKLIHALVQGILTEEKRLGVVIPSFGQIRQAEKKWKNLNPVITVASPYEKPEKIEEAAEKLHVKNVDLTVLDCIGYTGQMKQRVREITGKPVILARTVLARVLRELC